MSVRANRGTVALEFALVGAMLLTLILGIVDLGLLMWSKNALQSVATLTARCVAIGSPSCTNAQNYAVTLADNWIIAGVISTSNVTVRSVTSCLGASGTFKQVSITGGYWSSLPAPLNGITLTATGCYPS